jgi:DNA-binding HxlR family transcriptional regulator
MAKKLKTADLFDPNCSSRDVLELIGNKWTMLLLCALHDSKTRTGQLKRKLEGISQKMLTQTLREMQQHGIAKRISYPEVPPRVEYELTELGYSLAELVVKMERWIVKHHSILHAARTNRSTMKARAEKAAASDRAQA